MSTTTSVTIQVKHTIDRQRLEDLLVTAFEGGSNYWIKWARSVDGGDLYQAAFAHGIRVKADDEEHTRLLNLTAMEKGLQVMADKFPHHLGDILAEEDDATTGDVFLQLCLFGDVIYG